jgi:putative transposase
MTSALDYKFYYERQLPHLQPPGATLFVTFRLANSVPMIVQRKLLAETKRLGAIYATIADTEERLSFVSQEQRRLFGKWDSALHTLQCGPTWLRDPRIAGLIVESLHYRDKQVYTLGTFCIMPNHVHVVFTPLRKPDGSYHGIAAIMHSLKRHTARQANLILGRTGIFWQHESYDHVVRSAVEGRRILTYVLNNPVKARLVQDWDQWPWSYCSPDSE